MVDKDESEKVINSLLLEGYYSAVSRVITATSPLCHGISGKKGKILLS